MAAMATMCAVCAAAADVAVNVALVAADTRPTAAQTTRGGLSIAVAAAMNWQVSIGIGVRPQMLPNIIEGITMRVYL